MPTENARKGRVDRHAEPLTRGQRREAAGQSVEMPPVCAAGHLLDALWQVGPSMATGMGAAPITFGEIQAWQQLTGWALDAWEAKTLRRMSQAFVAQVEDARRRDCPPPWIASDARREPASIGRRIRRLLRD